MKTQENMRQADKKIYAGEAEKAQYLVHEQNDTTVRFAVRYPGKISPEFMEEAVKTVVLGIDVLHASFKPRAVEAVWVVHEEVAPEDYFALVETTEDVMAVAEKILVKPVLPEDNAQPHGTLIQGAEDCVLVVRISHYVADGGDGKYLLEKLVEAYNLIAEERNTEKLALKNGSRSVFQVYKGLSFKEFTSAIKPTMSTEKTVFPFPEEDSGYPQMVRKTLDNTLMQEIKVYRKKKNVTINDILLTAYSRAYVRLPGVDVRRPVNIMSMVDLRLCKGGDSEGISNMAGSMSTVVQMEEGESFEETLKKIAEQTQRQKDNPVAALNGMPIIQSVVKHTPIALAEKIADKAYGENMPVGLTNMGNFPVFALTLEGVPPIELIFGGPVKKKNGMQISASGLDGIVTLCCLGEYGDKDAEQIALFLKYMEKELRQAVSENLS